jgi:hypothetical protein
MPIKRRNDEPKTQVIVIPALPQQHLLWRAVHGAPSAGLCGIAEEKDPEAARFIENFKLMMAECPEHILEAGPKRLATVHA